MFYSDRLSKAASDTEIAIIGMAMVDNAIWDVLMSKLVGNTSIRKKLLAHYEHRRKLAHCLGIISLEEYQDIQVLSDVRNRFAHDMPTPTFENERIEQLCQKLSICDLARPAKETYERACYKIMAQLASALYGD